MTAAYSPPDPAFNYSGGSSLGNSWRIAGDGGDWGALTNCMNTQAAAAPYAGAGGWPDPDQLIGPKVYVGGQTDAQARAQFTLWCTFPANLLISQNVLAWSDYALETYSNAELIAINQDALASPARRIVGGDLPFPCHGGGGGLVASVVAAVCNASDSSQLFSFDSASGTISSAGPFPGAVLAAIDCATEDGTPVALYSPGSAGNCAGADRTWTHWPNGTVTNKNSGTCLDVAHGNGPTVDVWTCNGGTNQNFSFTEGRVKAGSDSMCLSAQALVPHTCDNVWGRALADGGFALAFVNNDVDADSSAITCDGACFDALLSGAAPGALRVRDLWAHEDVGTITAPFSWTANVNGSGFAAAYRLTPA